MAGLLQLCAIPGCTPSRFVRLGGGLLARMNAGPDATPQLIIARLTGDAIALGRFQRAGGALERARIPAELEVVRRLSGGRALGLGEGTVGVLLGVPQMGAMLSAPLPPARVMNRYIRGLLAGLTRVGAPGGAHYFGRDFVSAQGRQLAVLGQDNGTHAAVLEVLVALDRTLELPAGAGGYPAHGDGSAGGPPHQSLAALRGAPVAFEALVDAVGQGYADVHGVELRRDDALQQPEAELRPPVAEDEAGFSDSGVADVPIGFVEALVRHDGARVEDVRLRGDFIAPSFILSALEDGLRGCALELTALGERVDAAFHQPGACIHGVKDLRVLAEAILAAAGKL